MEPGGTDEFEDRIRRGWPSAALAALWPELGLPESARVDLIQADPRVLIPLLDALTAGPTQALFRATQIVLGASLEVDTDDLQSSARAAAEALRPTIENRFWRSSLLQIRADNHPGVWLGERIQSIHKASYLLVDASTELQAVSAAIRPTQRVFDALEEARGPTHGPFHRRLILRFHSFVAASHTFGDYLTRLANGTDNTELRELAKEIVHEPRTAFIRELRNIVLHQDILPTQPFPRIGAEGLPGSITMDRDRLLKIRGRPWRPQALEYLQAQQRVMHLGDLVDGHAEEYLAEGKRFIGALTRARRHTMGQGRLYSDRAKQAVRELATEATTGDSGDGRSRGS